MLYCSGLGVCLRSCMYAGVFVSVHVCVCVCVRVRVGALVRVCVCAHKRVWQGVKSSWNEKNLILVRTITDDILSDQSTWHKFQATK